MRHYIIRIQPASGPAYRYSGIFAHCADAILHALEQTQGTARLISAKVAA